MARAYTPPASEQTSSRMSYDEWQAWYDADDLNRGEWVNGEVVPFMPPLVSHADLVDFLFFLIGTYVRRRRLGRVYSETVELWLPKTRAARLPDIFYIAERHRDRITTHRVEGYADLVMEVVSKESAARDQREKFEEYRVAGIPEYWIIDSRPRRQTVRCFVLDDDDAYRELPADDDGRLRSRVLTGFWLEPAWLWQDPMPDVDDLLEQMMTEANG